MQLKIKDLPAVDRPRERLYSLGVGSLSLQELFGIVWGQGHRNGSVAKISADLLSKYKSLEMINSASLSELVEVSGLGEAKVAQIKAAFELGKRLQLERNQPSIGEMFTSLDACNIAAEYLRNEKKENLLLFCIDSRMRLLSHPKVISIGTLNASLIHPREIFVEAIKNYASAIILAHNHPSGASLPSDEDLDVTTRISGAGKIMGIKLIDHVIVGKGETCSIREYNADLFID